MPKSFQKCPKVFKNIHHQYYRIKTRLLSSLATELDQTIFYLRNGAIINNCDLCSFCCARILTRAVILEF